MAEHAYLVDFGSVQTLANKGGKTVAVVGTYGYMPPEQFGGAATGASDLYSLGATLITLATGIQPADLPQEDMRIAFEEVANLTPSFAEWLGWTIEPSLDRRASSAEIALKALETGKIVKAESEAVIQYKPVGTLKLFKDVIGRSLFLGGGVLTGAFAIYTAAVTPVLGALAGLFLGAIAGIHLGLVNGLLVGIITRLFFYPLKNPSLHRPITTLVSMLIPIAFGVIIFEEVQQTLFLISTTCVIAGLSMSVATKYFARWYEMQSKIKE